MKSLVFKSTFSLVASAIVALLIVVLIVFGVASKTHADTKQPQVGRLVTIYDRGTQKVILTQATTVEDALTQAGVSLAKEDSVEPSVSSKLVAKQYNINIYRARPVIVVDGAIKERIMTPYQTAQQIASSAGITLYSEDWTTLSRVDNLSEGAGLQLTINRATPVSFVLYGQPTTIRTHAKTVAELLKEKNISVSANDTLSTSLTQPITANIHIELWRNGKQTVNVDESLPYDTQVIDDADQPVGYSAVQSAGVNGSRTVTYEVDMKNGVEVSRQQIQSVVISQAKSQVEVHGTKLVLSDGYSAQRIDIMNQAGIATSDQGYVAYIVDHENGMWCPTRWQGQSVCTESYTALYAVNAQVGYGLCQATPGNKMASAGADWQTNPVTQLKWCSSYALGRYGSWSAAYTYWTVHHNW